MSTKIKKVTTFVVTFLMSLSFFNLVNADVLRPTVTNVYFEKEGKPYNKPVSFTINCYGYSWPPGPGIEKKPGTYTPKKVFSFSATCPKYGCKIYENYYLNYRHIDYCDIEGQADGKQFKIEKYSTTLIFSNCSKIESLIEKNGKYYQSNKEYKECLNSAEYYFATHEDNEKEYKRQLNLCDVYLVNISTSQIEKDDEGRVLEKKCELKIEIPSLTISNSQSQPQQNKGFFRLVIELIVCFFKKLFCVTCW